MRTTPATSTQVSVHSSLPRMFNPSIAQAMSDSPWWNTSAGLRQRFSGIERTSRWQRFAEAYDRVECEESRLKSWREANPKVARADDSLEALKDLAVRAAGQMPSLFLLARLTESVPTQEEAGMRLGRTVLRLIENSERYSCLGEQISLANEKPTRPSRLIAEGLEAFFNYLRREGKLPTNRQINIEAKRILKTECFDVSGRGYSETDGEYSNLKYGERFEDSYRVVSSCPFSETVSAVQLESWEVGRWNQTYFSKRFTKLAGFEGLPRR
jgi:hypothetical protein